MAKSPRYVYFDLETTGTESPNWLELTNEGNIGSP